jgi:hypothetical protein
MHIGSSRGGTAPQTCRAGSWSKHALLAKPTADGSDEENQLGAGRHRYADEPGSTSLQSHGFEGRIQSAQQLKPGSERVSRIGADAKK